MTQNEIKSIWSRFSRTWICLIRRQSMRSAIVTQRNPKRPNLIPMKRDVQRQSTSVGGNPVDSWHVHDDWASVTNRAWSFFRTANPPQWTALEKWNIDWCNPLMMRRRQSAGPQVWVRPSLFPLYFYLLFWLLFSVLAFFGWLLARHWHSDESFDNKKRNCHRTPLRIRRWLPETWLLSSINGFITLSSRWWKSHLARWIPVIESVDDYFQTNQWPCLCKC